MIFLWLVLWFVFLAARWFVRVPHEEKTARGDPPRRGDLTQRATEQTPIVGIGPVDSLTCD
jgi:hypothetical protein